MYGWFTLSMRRGHDTRSGVKFKKLERGTEDELSFSTHCLTSSYYLILAIQ